LEIHAYSFKCSKTCRNSLTNGCYSSTVISKAETEPQSFEIFNLTYNEIPNPTREMRELNPSEPDNPFIPEKWEVGWKAQHPESVQQGPSTATWDQSRVNSSAKPCNASDTARPSTGPGLAAAPGVTAPCGSANRALLGPGTLPGPPLTRAAPSRRRAPLDQQPEARPGPHPRPRRTRLARPDPEVARQEASSLQSSPWLEKVCTDPLLQQNSLWTSS